MTKWFFTYSTPDGKRGHTRITAASKPEAIRKGIDHARKHANGEPIQWNCKLSQA